MQTKIISSEEFYSPPPLDNKPFEIRQASATSNRYDVYLSEALDSSHKYVDLFHLLSAATENDVVYFHINCNGGSVDTGLQIITFMRDTRATVVTATYGSTCSMATAIFLSGDQFVVSKYARIMVHNFSGGMFGKGNELAAHIKSTTEWFGEAFKDIHIPFLTEEECNQVVAGRDIWMNSNEIECRLRTLVDYRDEQYKIELKLNQLEQLESIVNSLDECDEVQSIKECVDKLFTKVMQEHEPEPEPIKPKKPKKTRLDNTKPDVVLITE